MKAYTFSSIHKIQTFSEGNPDTIIYICETIPHPDSVLGTLIPLFFFYVFSM